MMQAAAKASWMSMYSNTGLRFSKLKDVSSLIQLTALMYQKPGEKLAIFRTVSPNRYWSMNTPLRKQMPRDTTFVTAAWTTGLLMNFPARNATDAQKTVKTRAFRQSRERPY